MHYGPHSECIKFNTKTTRSGQKILMQNERLNEYLLSFCVYKIINENEWWKWEVLFDPMYVYHKLAVKTKVALTTTTTREKKSIFIKGIYFCSFFSSQMLVNYFTLYLIPSIVLCRAIKAFCLTLKALSFGNMVHCANRTSKKNRNRMIHCCINMNNGWILILTKTYRTLARKYMGRWPAFPLKMVLLVA